MNTVTDPTLPPPTNPDVLTLAVAAVTQAAEHVPSLQYWLEGIDIEWNYQPRSLFEGHVPGFYAGVELTVQRMPAWRP